MNEITYSLPSDLNIHGYIVLSSGAYQLINLNEGGWGELVDKGNIVITFLKMHKLTQHRQNIDSTAPPADTREIFLTPDQLRILESARGNS